MTTDSESYLRTKSEELLAKLAVLCSPEDYKICVDWREEQLKAEKPVLKANRSWKKIDLELYLLPVCLTEKIIEPIYTTKPDYVKAGERTKIVLYGDPDKTGHFFLNYSYYETVVHRENGSSVVYLHKTGVARIDPELHGKLNVEKTKTETERVKTELNEIFAILTELKAAVQNELILSWLQTETGWAYVGERPRFLFGNPYTKKFYSAGGVFRYCLGSSSRKTMNEKDAKKEAIIYRDFSWEERKIKGLRISQLKEILAHVNMEVFVHPHEVSITDKEYNITLADFRRDRDCVFVDRRELFSVLREKMKETEVKYGELIRENQRQLESVQHSTRRVEAYANESGEVL